MAWVYLLIAAAFEIGLASSAKASDGFTRLGPTLLTALCTAAGIGFLTQALKDLPVSVGYPVWTGIGAVGTIVLGLVVFSETMTLVKSAALVAIVGGVIALRFAEAGSA